MDEQVIASMVERAFDFGCFLLSFCDHNTPTDQEFAKFADDVNEFATAGSFIQQPLRDPSVILSPLLLRILGHISNDCTTILKRLRKLLARLDSRYRTTATAATKNPFLRVGSHHKTQCHQSLKDFLGQKLVILHRSQIILAKSTFNVILAVINHARERPTRQHESPPAPNELHLLREQRRARTKVETQEALFREPPFREPPVRATLWLQPLPERQTGRKSIFDLLADVWAQPAPNTAQPAPNAAQIYLLEQRLERHDVHIKDLQNCLNQSKRYCNNQESEMKRLQTKLDRVQTEFNRLERTCIEQTWEVQRLRRDHQALKMENDELRKEKEDLQNDWDRWERYCNSQESEMKKLQTKFDRLEQTCSEQTGEMQRLRQGYQALKTENDGLRKEKKALHLEIHPLCQKNDDLQEQNERSKKDLARIRRERDTWRRYADNLKDKIARQPAMGPTSFPSQRYRRSSKHESYSSGSSSSTYTANSRESSRERHTLFKGMLNIL